MGEITYQESDLLPLSALQHLVFCPRQCALIYLEQAWEENSLTAEGRILHEKTDAAKPEWKGGVRIVRSLRLRSLRLGLTGVADVVEFHPGIEENVALQSGSGGPIHHEGVRVPGMRGRWKPFPVEYKRGKPKKDDSDCVQLCAQGLCLEEMLGARLPGGALFYGESRRRLDVEFDARLRARTEAVAAELHGLIARGVTPSAVFEPKCKQCSLNEICLPEATQRVQRVAEYVTRSLAGSASMSRGDRIGEGKVEEE